MKTTITINNLNKQYDNFHLKNINLIVKPNTILGIVGGNGAGKTTLIKSILGMTKISNGQVIYFDNKQIDEAKEDLGVILDDCFLPDTYTCKDINNIMKYMYNKWDKKCFFNYLQRFNIPKNKKLKELSKGMRKKVEIATVLSHKPKLLVLDEPTNGLDIIIRNEILDILNQYSMQDKNSIIISSHITSDLEYTADNIVFLQNGELIFNESKNILLTKYRILLCNQDELINIDNEDILKIRQTKNQYMLLIKNNSYIQEKYKQYNILSLDLEKFLLFHINNY